MIAPREKLVSPTTGERVALLETSAETGGERLTLELRARSGALSLLQQAGAEQTQVLEVLAGTLGARIDGREVLAAVGDVVVADAGRERSWWNPGPEELVVRVRVRPALDAERLLRMTLVPAGSADSSGVSSAEV